MPRVRAECYSLPHMLNRVAALTYCGRSYRLPSIRAYETEMPFEEAAFAYRGIIESGKSEKDDIEQAASFLFFSGRNHILTNLESILLESSLVTPDLYAYCAYSRATDDIPGAIDLIKNGIDAFPGDPKLPNDLVRLNMVNSPGTPPAVDGSSRAMESFQGISSALYLIYFLYRRRLINELPLELHSTVKQLETIAGNSREHEEACLTAIELASLTGDFINQEKIIVQSLQSYAESFDVLAEAARFELTRGEHRIEMYSPLLCAQSMCRIRPWHPEGFHLKGLIMTTRTPALPVEGTLEAFEKAYSIDSGDRQIVEDYLAGCAVLSAGTEDPMQKQQLAKSTGKLLKDLSPFFRDDPDFLAKTGTVFLENGLVEQGEQLIEEALKRAPELPAVLAAAGSAAVVQSMEPCRQEDTANLLNTAEKLFHQAYKKEPDPQQRGLYLLGLINIYQKTGKAEEEMRMLHEGVEENIPALDIYFRLSEIYHTLGHTDKAVEALKSGYSAMPDSVDLGIETARALSQIQEFTGAVVIADALTSRYPNAPWLFNQLGIIYVEWGNALPEEDAEKVDKYRIASKAFSRACTLDTREGTYRSNYGDALRLFGEKEKAIRELKESLKIKPEDPFSLNALGLIQCDYAREQKKREDQETFILEAEHFLTRASTSDPGNPLYLINLADMFYDLGYFEETIELYQKIIEVEDAWQYYDIVGLCNYHIGNYEEAEKWFSLALEREPDAAEVINSLGLCSLGKGKMHMAIEYFKQASLLDPVNPVYIDNIAMAQYNMDGYTTDLGDSPRM